MRAALYARFSSELQSPTSIADQLHACSRYAERLGAVVVAQYEDAAISGTSIVNRPGVNALLADAAAGRFDIVVTEALDRLARDNLGNWQIYYDLADVGIPIDTISEGRIDEEKAGFKGLMNSLHIRELGRKTRRGQAGVARSGRKAAGSPPYGYRLAKVYDAAGEPIRGIIERDEERLAVVERILAEFAAGASPRSIVARLNAEGIPGPGGRMWSRTTVNGCASRGTGMLHNETYRGRLVHGRHQWTKNRRTAKRVSKAGDPNEIVRVDRPDLRIGSDELWAQVDARLAEQREAVKRKAAAPGQSTHAPWQARRPKRVLSGLMRCGSCGGSMVLGGPDQRWLCLTRRDGGVTACSNGRTARNDKVEALVMEAIRQQMLQADIIEAVVREYHKERARLAAGARAQRGALERELADVTARAGRLVDLVADGGLAGPTVTAKLAELEARREVLQAQLADAGPSSVVDLHPGVIDAWRRHVDRLQAALATDDTLERQASREAFRRLVKGVVLSPLEGRGKFALSIEGDLGPLVQSADGYQVRSVTAERTFSRHSPNLEIPVRLTA